MSSNVKKQVKALIGSLIVNDQKRTDMLIKELSESLLAEKEEHVMKVIMESFKGETNV